MPRPHDPCPLRWWENLALFLLAQSPRIERIVVTQRVPVAALPASPEDEADEELDDDPSPRAYTEYLEPAQRASSMAWVREHPRLLVTRTLAKIYGLAGLRIGFGVGDPVLIDLCNRVRQPFNVNSVALAAAVAALGDDDFVARSAQANREGMAQMRAGLDALGVPYIPSAANFLAVEVGDAAAINAGLLNHGVIVRPVAGYGMPRHLRVSIGLPHENQRFLEVLADLLGKG